MDHGVHGLNEAGVLPLHEDSLNLCCFGQKLCCCLKNARMTMLYHGEPIVRIGQVHDGYGVKGVRLRMQQGLLLGCCL
jgi:hypothetical protein